MNSNCNFDIFYCFIKKSFHSQRLNEYLFEFSFGKGKVLRTKKTNYEKESKNNLKGVSLKLPISKNLSILLKINSSCNDCFPKYFLLIFFYF